jgi:hypothetical protein
MTGHDTSQPSSPSRRLTTADLQPIADTLGIPRRDHRGRRYLDTPTGRIQLSGRNAKELLRTNLSFAARSKFSDRTAASKAVLDQVAGQILVACDRAPCDPKPDDAQESWSTGFDQVPAGWQNPDGWRVTAGGISREGGVSPSGDLMPPQSVTDAPVLIVTQYTDPDGGCMVDLAWHAPNGVWRVRTIDRGIVISGKRLVKELGNAGLPTTERRAGLVEQWLSESLRQNRFRTPQLPVARWLGWQSPTEFLTSPGAGTRFVVRDPKQETAASAHHQAGTLDGWRAAVQVAADWPVLRIVLTAGLASVLLRPLGLPSTTLDIFGRSSGGKSIAAKAAFSCWGDPSPEGGGIALWADRGYAKELRLTLVRGIPVVLDESQNLGRYQTAEDVSAFVYAIPNDRGSARGGPDYLSAPEWSTIVISTGEKSLLAFDDRQGAAPRRIPVGTLPIPKASSLGISDQDIRRQIKAFEDGIGANYGHAGPAFVARLTQEIATKGAGWLKARHRELTEACQGPTAWTGRRAPHVAALVLASELASAWEIIPVPHPDWAVWEDLMLSDEAVSGEDQVTRTIEAVNAALTKFQGGIDHGDNREQPPGGWVAKVGLVLIGDDRVPAVMATGSQVREWLSRAGLDYQSALVAWKADGAILSFTQEKDGKEVRRWTHRARIGGALADVIVFHPDHISAPLPPVPPSLPG